MAAPGGGVAELTELPRFTAELPFSLDDFQQRACAALERGHGVLVCAPTGAGKTVVGEFAVHLALAAGGKCFYTTPIKALSNQKHTDLTARYGRDRIGLLTGDMSVNADAPVVVMTTEVLRNMLYADSPALQGLSHVVMDEVHFLADRMRGAVWEEVILHLPDEVRLVSLSATVSNAEEFGGWIQTVRGDTTVVVDEHRPVPLWQHVLVGKRLLRSVRLREPETGRRSSSARRPRTGAPHRASPRGGPDDATGSPAGKREEAGRGAAGPATLLPAAGAAGRDRVAGLRRAVAGDHLRVLPGRLRRRGPAVPALAAAAHQRGGTRPDRRGDRPPMRRSRGSRPGGARLLRVAGGVAARVGGPPRRDAAGLPAHGRGAVHRRPGQGGVRHRDLGVGHQHACPHGGARAAGEVQRRAARAADAGGVHAADRAGRPARHRRRGSRGGALASRRGDLGTGGGGRAWRPPARSRCAARSRRRTT